MVGRAIETAVAFEVLIDNHSTGTREHQKHALHHAPPLRWMGINTIVGVMVICAARRLIAALLRKIATVCG